MNVYTVHYRQEAANSLTGLSEDTILVKDGFSWPALLFPLIWFLMNRMWIPAVIYVAFGVVMAALAAWIQLRTSAKEIKRPIAIERSPNTVAI